MNKPIRQAFDNIEAEADLKCKTLSVLFSQEKLPKQYQRRTLRRKMSVAIASFILLFVGGSFSGFLYYAPAASISIDTNPSLELTVNRFDRVVDFNGYNADGKKLLEGVQLKYEKCDTALERIVSALAAQGYLLPDSLLSVTLQTNDAEKEKQLLQKLQTTANSAMTSHHSQSEVEVYPISSEVSEHAHKLHLSPAKYLAISKLQKIDASVTMEGCRNHSVKELRDMAMEGESHLESHNTKQQGKCNEKNSSAHGHRHGNR